MEQEGQERRLNQMIILEEAMNQRKEPRKQRMKARTQRMKARKKAQRMAEELPKVDLCSVLATQWVKDALAKVGSMCSLLPFPSLS